MPLSTLLVQKVGTKLGGHQRKVVLFRVPMQLLHPFVYTAYRTGSRLGFQISLPNGIYAFPL
jgi:hypothetical protein